MSGRNQQFAKLSYVLKRTEGSNPSLTAGKEVREVAQAGSASGLGPGGRRFESCLPD